MVPVAGSAYTYAYATLGELFAWIIGWDLLLEYAVCASAVATGWSDYFEELLRLCGIYLPKVLCSAPFDYSPKTGKFFSTGAYFDLPAVLVTAGLTAILVVGIRESARFNSAMVIFKLAVVLFVIVVGAWHVNPSNWKPFAPYGFSGMSFFGKPIFGQSDADGKPLGMLAAAAIMFFSYIGFDSVSTQSEEAKNPSRDVPIGILGSLLICTILYIGVAAVLTGMVPYAQIHKEAAGVEGVRVPRAALRQLRHLDRGAHRNHVCLTRDPPGSTAHLIGDGARRTAAQELLRRDPRAAFKRLGNRRFSQARSSPFLPRFCP